MIQFALFVLCELIIIGFMASFVLTQYFGSPFYPSNSKAVANIIKLTNLQKGQTFVDLGSGDGRLILALARKGYTAHGVEYNPYLVFLSNFLIFISGNWNRGRVYLANIYKHDISNYDVVYAYLFPKPIQKLKNRFKNETKKGAKVVINTFKIDNWKISEQIDKFYLYLPEENEV